MQFGVDLGAFRIQDIALAGVAVGAFHHDVGFGDVVVGILAVAEQLGSGQHSHFAPLGDVNRVACGSNDGVGHWKQENAVAAEVGTLVAVGAQQGVVGEVPPFRVGADESCTWQVGYLGQAHADVHGIEPLGGAARPVGNVEHMAVHIPSELVGPCLVLHQLQVGAPRPVGHGEFGAMVVVVDL